VADGFPSERSTSTAAGSGSHSRPERCRLQKKMWFRVLETRGRYRGDPYQVHVPTALARAKAKEIRCPAEVVISHRSIDGRMFVESHILRGTPSTRNARWSLTALLRSAQRGDMDRARARRLIRGSRLENLSLDRSVVVSVLGESSIEVTNRRSSSLV